MRRFSVVVAACKHSRGIGAAGKLPWSLRSDMAYFKQLTRSTADPVKRNAVIMGRKTFLSIGRVLPGRPNIIVTRDRDFRAEGAEIVHSLEDALAAAKAHGTGEIMVIGGADIFGQALPIADKLDICHVHAEVPGDTFFPEIDPDQWTEASREDHNPDQSDGPSYSFVVYNKG